MCAAPGGWERVELAFGENQQMLWWKALVFGILLEMTGFFAFWFVLFGDGQLGMESSQMI